MHTVELFEQAVDLAGRLGYEIRHEWLDGGGGGCELMGRKIFFLDLALPPMDQLDQLLDTLRRDTNALRLPMTGALRETLAVRKIA